MQRHLELEQKLVDHIMRMEFFHASVISMACVLRERLVSAFKCSGGQEMA
jgi:hypothetical protein